MQHIKLLLPDPDQARVRTPASERHKRRREELVRVLGKQPIAVFEDFMNAVVSEVVNSAKRCYGDFSSNQVELALAFPSGWPESVHREVAAIGARAMTKALAGNKIVNIKFGIHNVYTLSETLCGVKEWLEANIDDAAASMDLDMLPTNINELNVSRSSILLCLKVWRLTILTRKAISSYQSTSAEAQAVLPLSNSSARSRFKSIKSDQLNVIKAPLHFISSPNIPSTRGLRRSRRSRIRALPPLHIPPTRLRR